jgi:uncharacterized protein (TIGR02271 family)
MGHIEQGWKAVDRNGEEIGTVEEIGANYFTLTKGLIFKKDIYIPLSAVAGADGDQRVMRVDVDKDQVDSMGWDQPPVETGAASGFDTDTTYGTSNDSAFVTNTTSDTSYAATDATPAYDASSTASVDDSVRVSLHEEQLRAGTVREQTGEVDITKTVVEEQQSIDVPVTREQVEIRRFAVDRPADSAEISDTDTIRVPVSAEQVVVDKDVRVVEEIEIDKHAVTETQRVSDTVRREQVNVEQDGDVNVTGDAGRSSRKGSRK